MLAWRTFGRSGGKAARGSRARRSWRTARAPTSSRGDGRWRDPGLLHQPAQRDPQRQVHRDGPGVLDDERSSRCARASGRSGGSSWPASRLDLAANRGRVAAGIECRRRDARRRRVGEVHGGMSRAFERRASSSPAQSRTSWPRPRRTVSHLAASKVTPSTPARRVPTIPIRIRPSYPGWRRGSGASPTLAPTWCSARPVARTIRTEHDSAPNCGSALVAAQHPTDVRKTVTVLFADIVGSTRLGEQTDPESTRRCWPATSRPCAASSSGTAAPSRSSSAMR